MYNVDDNNLKLRIYSYSVRYTSPTYVGGLTVGRKFNMAAVCSLPRSLQWDKGPGLIDRLQRLEMPWEGRRTSDAIAGHHDSLPGELSMAVPACNGKSFVAESCRG